MKSLFKLLPILLFISATTSSCVSNYVTSNYSKYPSTRELLVTHNMTSSKGGPNANNDPKLVTEQSLIKTDGSQIENINIYTEKAYSQEAFNLITEAKTYLGTPYRYGGTTRNGIDCSSFVQHVFDAFSISLPRTSILQSREGESVKKEDLRKGDLIFFAQTPKSRVSHVGIVESVSPTGEIFFIHASSSQGVTVSSLDMAYWTKRFKAGKRILRDEENESKNQEDDNLNLVKLSF